MHHFTLAALATVAAATGAFAQSTVTLFGGADLNYRSVNSGANKFTGMAQDGIYSSRFGVMGTEDLGGGLKAGFHFEGGLAPDVGSPALNFVRKQVISLSSGFGEVRLGRDYTPLFTVAGIADPFGTNGVGSSYNLANNMIFGSEIATVASAPAEAYLYRLTAASSSFITVQSATANLTNTLTNVAAPSTVKDGIQLADPFAVRANNSIAYYSPVFSGFSASLMYSFGAENTALARSAGTMTSLKLAYTNGPLTVAFANQETKGGVPVANAAIAAVPSLGLPAVPVNSILPSDDQKYTTSFLAASYNLGVAKISAGYKTDKLSAKIDKQIASTPSAKTTILGVSAPLGALTLKASYVARKFDNEKMGNQVAFGGVYDLSKRTAVYATYSALKNEAGYGMTVGSAAASDFTGLRSKGFETGIKHSF